MKYFNNTKRTRFKVSIFVIFFNMIMAFWSFYTKNTDVTIIAMAAISASGIVYKYVETKTPSIKRND